MNEQLEERLEELYSKTYEKMLSVYQVFIDYFGEDRVDLQGIWNKDRYISYLKAVSIMTYLSRPSEWTVSKWNTIKNNALTELNEEDRGLLITNFFRLVNTNIFQRGNILVWWPSVRITNEHDRYEDITNLYAKVTLEFTGSLHGRFMLNRSEYTLLHLKGGYMHSHVRSIPTTDFTQFQNCCTGSGPINDTMCSLNRECDLDIWQLFCVELDKYVHVESLAGGPYHRLEEIGVSNMSSGINNFTFQDGMPYYANYCINDAQWDLFLKTFIYKKLLKFDFIDGSYSIGMSYVDFMLIISNVFIEWYNNLFNEGKIRDNLQKLVDNSVIKQCIIANSKIYYPNAIQRVVDYKNMEGKLMCMFKDREIKIHIVDIESIEDSERNILYILSPDIAMCFLNKILKILNYRYGRNKEEGTKTQLGSDVYFI